MRSRRLAPALCVAILALCSAPSRAGERGYVLFGVGWFNISAAQDPVQLDVEWRGVPKAARLQINAGAMVNGDGGFYGFGGLCRDFVTGNRWGLSLGLGVGLWEAGSGLDLGGSVQIRSSLELFMDTTDRSRVGFTFYHLSNAGLHKGSPGSELEANPGSNSIVFLYGRRLK